MKIPPGQRRTTSIETPNMGPNTGFESGVLRANGKRRAAEGGLTKLPETSPAEVPAFARLYVAGEYIAYVDSGSWLSFDGGRRPLTYERTFGSIPAG